MTKRIAQTLAASVLLLFIGLFMIFRPNGDVGAFIQHPATAAWLQGVGSVAAIMAAIWIDQGAARRAEMAGRRAKAELKLDWEQCLIDITNLAQNAARLGEQEPAHRFDNPDPRRLIDNAVMMVDVYLRQAPPNPRLAFALAAARSHLEVPRDHLRHHHDLAARPGVFVGGPPDIGRLKAALRNCAEKLEVLVAEYRLGAW